MYRLDDGYGPPSASWEPSGVRMSRRTLPAFLSRMVATVGSVVMPPSMEPCWSAAMKVGPAPTATGVKSLTFSAFLTARYLVRKSVDDPSLVMPSFLPLKSLGDLMSPSALLETI